MAESTRRQPVHLRHAPVQTIPSEVLAEIFKQCDHYPNRLLLPLLLSQICTRWRGVALAFPHLWTDISITSRTPLDLVAGFLERSKQSLINICWHVSHNSTPGASDHVTRTLSIINLLRTHCQRWRRFALTLDSHTLRIILSRLEDVCASRLEYLYLVDLEIDPDTPLPSLSVLRHGAPVLSFLQLGGCVPAFPALSSLTTLSLSFLPRHTTRHCLVRMFRSLSSLEDLHLSFCQLPLEFLDVVQMPTLRSLTIKTYSAAEVNRVHMLLDAPALESLSIACHSALNFSSVFSMLECESAPGYPELRFLELNFTGCRGTLTLNTRLLAFDKIEHFKMIGFSADVLLGYLLSEAESGDACANSQTSSLGTPTVSWPVLNTLSITHFSPSALCQMISVRRAMGRPLRSMSVPCDTLDKELEVWIKTQGVQKLTLVASQDEDD